MRDMPVNGMQQFGSTNNGGLFRIVNSNLSVLPDNVNTTTTNDWINKTLFSTPNTFSSVNINGQQYPSAKFYPQGSGTTSKQSP